MKHILSIFMIIFIALMSIPSIAGWAGKVRTNGFSAFPQDEKHQWAELRKRFAEEYLRLPLWTLTALGESKSEARESDNLLQVLFNSLAKDDPALLNQIGGLEGFKARFLKLMKSDDAAVSGFAAIVLAISGDLNYAPQIAALLEKKDKASIDEYAYPPIKVRGQAAMALGLLGAKEYTPKIVLLLQSKHVYDRAGAAIALGYLGAKEHAQEVVNILLRKGSSFIDDDSPIYSLMKMGVAESYKKEIAQVLNDRSREGESRTTAAYALAHLRAKEYAGNIAKLLNDEYRKGAAAIALAILGAKEYTQAIALLLDDKSFLNQKDALVALGILKAKGYAPNAAKLLNAKGAILSNEEDYLRYYAAVSLILMEASEYAKDVVPIIEKTLQSGAYMKEQNFFLFAGEATALIEGDLHPLVREEVVEINNRFKGSLAKIKSQEK